MLGCTQAATMNERWHLTEPFKLVFRTTDASETVTIPCQNVGKFRAWIDWGDGSAKSEVKTYNSANLAHVYATAGDYTVSITGSFPNICFNNTGDKLKLREIVAWGKTGFKRLSYAFYGCTNLTSTATDGGGSTIAFVDSLMITFRGCANFNGPIGNWNTGNNTNLQYTFANMSAFNQPVGNWNTEKVTDFLGVFYSCTSFNQELANWNPIKAYRLYSMFESATVFNKNIGNWNTSNCTNMARMFFNATAFSQDLSAWAVGHIPSEPLLFGNSGTDPTWGTAPYSSVDPISYVGSGTGTTTATLPAHQAGDFILGFAFRDGSTTNPSVPAGWTTLSAALDGTACSGSLAWKRATSSSETSGTWTNATGLIVLVYRGVHPTQIYPINPFGTKPDSTWTLKTGTGTTITYLENATWTSPQAWTICVAGHCAVDTALETPPAGLTLRAAMVDATNEVAAFDSNGPAGAWPATDVSAGGTSDNWLTLSMRLIPNYR